MGSSGWIRKVEKAKTVGGLDIWSGTGVWFSPRRQKGRESIAEMGVPARGKAVRVYR